MISDDTFAILRNKYQTNDLNVRREYIQHLFLSCFYQQPQADKIFFKGGTALRIVYKSPRFSEDLDFGSTLNNVNEIEKAVLETLIAIHKEGITTEIIESIKTSGGYLAVIDFELGSATVRLQIEISFREKDLKGELESIQSDFIPAYTINTLSQEQLIDGKLHALLERHKARDFYDLYFLLQKDMILPNQKSILKKTLEMVIKTQVNFRNELEQFLPHSHRQVIKDFKEVLARTLNKFI